MVFMNILGAVAAGGCAALTVSDARTEERRSRKNLLYAEIVFWIVACAAQATCAVLRIVAKI